MLLRSMSAENYRSLRSIRMDLGRVNLFVGENGAGKSNLYRSLQLVQSAVRGTFAQEIAAEGGMASALWTATGAQSRSKALFQFRFEFQPWYCCGLNPRA